MKSIDNITEQIVAYAQGEKIALGTVVDALYVQLCKIADGQLKKLNPGAITPAELVHELYLKLSNGLSVHVKSRRHFFAIAAQAMRQLIVDELKAQKRAKRGGYLQATTLSDSKMPLHSNTEEILAVDAAMQKLHDIDPKLATTVECRYFVGYSEKETAQILDVSVRSVRRYWTVAKRWLVDEFEPSNEKE